MDQLLLTEKNIEPNDQLIHDLLKDSYQLYKDIAKQLEVLRPNIVTEWKFYGKKNGWLLKHLDGKRNLFFLLVYDGFFKLTFTFGDLVVKEILASDLISVELKEQLKGSMKYAEGTSLLVSIKSDGDVKQALELIKFKLA